MGSLSGIDESAQRQRYLEEQVQGLLQEVNALETKLGDLHATDLSSLRRAYKTLAQHVQALDVETKHLPALVDRATEAAVTPEFVARQAQVVAAAAAVVYGVGRLLRTLRVPDAGPLSGLLALLGSGYVGVRLVVSTFQQLGVTASRRQRASEELKADVRAVRERIQVMLDLADTGLRLHRLHPSQQHQLQQLPPGSSGASNAGSSHAGGSTAAAGDEAQRQGSAGESIGSSMVLL